MARILNFTRLAVLVVALGGVGAMQAVASPPPGGAGVFHSQCSICHGIAANSPNSVGPRLFGVVGRHAGAVPGFNYSPAMKRSGLVWSPDTLRRYLADPARTVPGNKMPYPGLHNPNQVEDLVTYLGSLR